MIIDRYMNLQLFAAAGTNVNTTTGTANAYTGATTTSNDMEPGMRVFYNGNMLDNMRDDLVYGQFAQKVPLPDNEGNVYEWHKWNTLPPIQRLIEGVYPTGKKFGQTKVTATIAQYGDYVTLSEQLDKHHVDPVITGATQELSAAAAKTQDTLQRDAILAQGTSVIYADTLDASGNVTGTPTAVYALQYNATYKNPITPDTFAQVKTYMDANKVPLIGGKWIAGVMNPYAIYDIIRNPEFIDFHKYEATEELFAGEVGELYGIRIVKSTNAPILLGDPLYSATQRYLTCASSGYSTLGSDATITNGYGHGTKYRFTVTETLANATTDLEKLIGQYVLFSDAGTIDDRLIIAGIDVTNKYIYTETAPTDGSATTGDYLLPGNGGAESQSDNKPVAVFASIFLGKDAFADIDPASGALQVIVKDKGEIGGALEIYSTVGVKFEMGPKVLYPERCVIVYHTGKYSGRVTGNWRM